MPKGEENKGTVARRLVGRWGSPMGNGGYRVPLTVGARILRQYDAELTGKRVVLDCNTGLEVRNMGDTLEVRSRV